MALNSLPFHSVLFTCLGLQGMAVSTQAFLGRRDFSFLPVYHNTTIYLHLLPHHCPFSLLCKVEWAGRAVEGLCLPSLLHAFARSQDNRPACWKNLLPVLQTYVSL